MASLRQNFNNNNMVYSGNESSRIPLKLQHNPLRALGLHQYSYGLTGLRVSISAGLFGEQENHFLRRRELLELDTEQNEPVAQQQQPEKKTPKAKPVMFVSIESVAKEPITEYRKGELLKLVHHSKHVNTMMQISPHLNAMSYGADYGWREERPSLPALAIVPRSNSSSTCECTSSWLLVVRSKCEFVWKAASYVLRVIHWLCCSKLAVLYKDFIKCAQ